MNLKRLSEALRRNTPADQDVMLCLDFGTAMSKAFASRTVNAGDFKLIELALGRQAGEPGSVYPVTSAAWISEDGRVFVGEEAVAESLNPVSGSGVRLDSLKLLLRENIDKDLRDIDPLLNPSGVAFTVRDMMLTYLSFLTDLVGRELVRHGVSPYVMRRFATPAWPTRIRQKATEDLTDLFARSQVLADVLHNQWSGGIPAKELRKALDAVTELEALPMYLIAEPTLEPVAAGTGRLESDDDVRGLAIIVDVGAGTTDLCVFLITQRRIDRKWCAWQVGKPSAIDKAGNTIDEILVETILQQTHISLGDPNYIFAKAYTGSRVRAYKERLFRQKTVTYTVSSAKGKTIGYGTIKLSEFLNSVPVMEFGRSLRTALESALSSVSAEILGHAGFGKLGFEVKIAITGGGGSMPMVQELTAGQTRLASHQIVHRPATELPWFVREESPLARAYGQMAVAIGGCWPELVANAGTLDVILGSSGRKHKLGGFA